MPLGVTAEDLPRYSGNEMEVEADQAVEEGWP